MGRNSKRTQECYASGLLAFHKFIGSSSDSNRGGGYTLQSIIKSLTKGELDVYKILNNFVTYLMRMRNKVGSPIANSSLDNYMSAVRSYLQFHDIDISSNKFRRKVKMPRLSRQDEEAIDAADIRTILLSCSNRRLKPYMLVLASAGLRATEACAIRVCDIEFNGGPTKIHVRTEYTKTKLARDVYISDEATKFLQEWLKWKYRKRVTRTIYGIKRLRESPKIQTLFLPIINR
jgi:integrase